MTTERKVIRAFRPTLGLRLRGAIEVDATCVPPDRYELLGHWIATSVLTRLALGEECTLVVRYR